MAAQPADPLKLYYFRDPTGNFGDDLNPWLWPQVAPGLLDDREQEMLVGIGTLLNHRLPADPVKHVMGSGAGYGDLPKAGADLVIHAVRGPLTARALGLAPDRAVTDAAVLIRTVSTPPVTGPRSRVGVMFTGHALHQFDWQSVCEEAGFTFISCHWPVERVLPAMLACDVLLTEAMHGAIVADALRVPWIPITCTDIVLSFKWQDWLASLAMTYEPSAVEALVDARHMGSDMRRRSINAVKRSVHTLGLWKPGWGDVPKRDSGPAQIKAARTQLIEASRRKPFLSDERLLHAHVVRFQDLLARLIEAQRTAVCT